ncbi:MAG: Pr6Pr family membrane protein [Acidiferrobacterales bacterium]|nr:Pr6Pr family membrane protein [Acidiferrobacterales bacterium]
MARTSAGILTILTLAGLSLRFVLAAEQYGSFSAGASHLSQFFTIVTNILILCVMALITIGKGVPRVVVLASVVSIVGVGIIHHALLSQLSTKDGLDELANQAVHTVVPLLAFIWWVVCVDSKAIKWRDSLFALIWPSAYCGYALIRAEYSNFYPYGFIDLAKLGWSGLAQSVFALTIIFWVLALLIIGIGKLFTWITAKYAL